MRVDYITPMEPYKDAIPWTQQKASQLSNVLMERIFSSSFCRRLIHSLALMMTVRDRNAHDRLTVQNKSKFTENLQEYLYNPQPPFPHLNPLSTCFSFY